MDIALISRNRRNFRNEATGTDVAIPCCLRTKSSKEGSRVGARDKRSQAKKAKRKDRKSSNHKRRPSFRRRPTAVCRSVRCGSELGVLTPISDPVGTQQRLEEKNAPQPRDPSNKPSQNPFLSPFPSASVDGTLHPPHGRRAAQAEVVAAVVGLGEDLLRAAEILGARGRSRVGFGPASRRGRAVVRDNPLADLAGDEVSVAEAGREKKNPGQLRSKVM